MYAQRIVASPLIHCVWYARVEHTAAFVDPASEYWGLAFTRHVGGALAAELIGPRIEPLRLDIGEVGTEYWGVEFRAHTAITAVDKRDILGVFGRLPVSDGLFALAGGTYVVPKHDGLETLVAEFERRGAIAAHANVARALEGVLDSLSERSLQRHVVQTTGLTRKQIAQLERARYACRLLQRGLSIANAAVEAGYADQAHLTRALRQFHDETPGQILTRVRRSAGRGKM